MPSTLTTRKAPPPAFWMVFVTHFLQARPALARRLWQAFAPGCSAAARWQLMLCTEIPTPDRIMHFAALISPKDLLHAAESLCPPGTRRPREVILLEEHILERTSKDGTWV